jgi:hypothetical protein
MAYSFSFFTDLLTYNTEVTALRELGLLDEIRTKTQVYNLAQKLRKPKDQIARYKIKKPL